MAETIRQHNRVQIGIVNDISDCKQCCVRRIYLWGKGKNKIEINLPKQKTPKKNPTARDIIWRVVGDTFDGCSCPL